MNEQQLTQVLDGVSEATAFQPGEAPQLVPAATTMQAAPDAIIVSATSLAANIIALYQRRVETAQAKLASMRDVAEELIATAERVAAEVKTLDQRDDSIDTGIRQVLRDNGIASDDKV